MAAAVTSRAMAQQPLHPFFDPGRRDERLSVKGPTRDEAAAKETEEKVEGHSEETLADIDEDPNYERRKRRRTTPLGDDQIDVSVDKPSETSDMGQHGEQNGSKESTTVVASAVVTEPTVLTASIPQTDGAAEVPKKGNPVSQPTTQTPTKNRMLKIRADGKLKSPGTTEQPPETKAKRKRKSGGKHGKQGICIKYGRLPHDRLAFGKKVDQILSGKLRVAPAVLLSKHVQKINEAPEKPSKVTVGRTTDQKSTHPFFLGSSKQAAANDSRIGTADKKTSGLTGSDGFRSNEDTSKPAKTAWPVGFGASFSKPVKVPGEVAPLWPPHEMQHIRGLSNSHSETVRNRVEYGYLERRKKGKGRAIIEEEEVYRPQRDLVASMKGMAILTADSQNKFFRQIPQKLLVSSADLQSRLKMRLLKHAQSTRSTCTSLTNETSDYAFRSDAAAELFRRVEVSLTAFETFDGDTQDWCHKYAPKRTAHLLQNQADVILLRDWVRALNVDQVNAGGAGPYAKLDAKKQLAAKRKKRKLKDELDDFVVSSEDDVADADELTEPEADPMTINPASDKPVSTLKKLKPSGFSKTRAVLIVGPHGCGKSTSVSAVAAELGFEIFEINAGVRRNGRDIMDRVGDMTRNHLVSNDRKDEATQGEAETVPSVDEPIDEKQQSVTSFFKSEPAASSAPRRGRPPKKQTEQSSKLRKTQRQSLILLEEVDVLFEEDKPFWSAVFTLMVQSRRPIIMTCSDERSLPLAEFVDTAILRLSGPSAATASEYLMCMAANEGHLLEQTQVDKLVEIRRGDIRGSICDLQFWCQMAVGDDRNGIRWFLDASAANKQRRQGKESMRLVSNDTLDFDWVVSGNCSRDQQSSLQGNSVLFSEMYGFFGGVVDATEFGSHLRTTAVPKRGEPVSRNENLTRLQDAHLCSDALSAADTWFFSPADGDLLDASQPEISAQVRSNYVSDFTLLQADVAEEPSGLSTAISFAVRASVQRQLTGSGATENDFISLALRAAPSMTGIKARTYGQTRRKFEELTEAEEGTPWNPSRGPGISILHGGIGMIAADVAPTVRAIALFDLELADERRRLADVMDGSGKAKKRQRKTRAARAALEGGSKASTRREKWWHRDVDYRGMLATAGSSWTELALQALRQTRAQNAATVEEVLDEQEIPSSDPVVDTAAESMEESVEERSPGVMVLVE